MELAGNVEKALLAQMGNPDSPLIKRVTRNNQILLHNYQVEVIKSCRCALSGCENSFAMVLIPNQILYPKFCREHRTEHRREFHLQRLEGSYTSTVESRAVFSSPS